VTVQIGSFGPNFLKWTKRTGLVLEDSCSLSVLLTAAGCVIAALEDFLLIFSGMVWL
ncbi:unnamed protein product, partial [Brassica oleracea]